MVKEFRLVVSLVLLHMLVSCDPPVFMPSTDVESEFPSNWENTGNLNASFISTSRSIGVNTNTGSPSFDVSFIASANNIDSLAWSFPGGITNDSISEITETVRYESFGRFDVGLKVYNLEDSDSRYLENFIQIFYQDDLDFMGIEPTSWTVTGTGATPLDFAAPTDASTSLPYSNWVIVPFDAVHKVKAVKTFEDFPGNNLILEFDYKLERVPTIYINDAYKASTSSSIISPTAVTYVSHSAIGTTSNTRVDSPVTYSGTKRFSIELNGIPIWIASRISEDFFEHVRIELPSLSVFQIGLVKEPQSMVIKQLSMAMDASPADNPTRTASTTVLTSTFDIDNDGILNSIDNDQDGDGYLDTTEDAFTGDKSNPNVFPNYTIKHVHYPYNLNIRNLTIRIKETED